MSTKYPGGFITKSPVAPTTTAASGVWTLDQQQQYQKAGTWPAPPNYIEEVFSTYLYTGNGSTQTITNGINLSTYGGLVWTKRRSGALSHYLVTTSLGTSNYLSTDSTDAQGSTTTLLTPSTTGFDFSSNTLVNANTASQVAWTFREQPKFFDVVTYTGTGVARTIAHSLGSVPGCIIVKCTNAAGKNWQVYHTSLGNTKYINLNLTSASTSSSTIWNSTTPTSTVFSLGADGLVNDSGDQYVAYLFAHNAGGFGLTGTDNVISCGSFTTTAGGVGTVTLGYEPQWVLIKNTTTGGAGYDWFLLDSMRGMTSPPTAGGAALRPNTSGAEATGQDYIQATSTGFVVNNNPSSTYIYIAIRRGPMKVPTSGTSVFSPIAANNAQGTQNTTGFPVDLQMQTFRGGVSDHYVVDRLRGVSTNATNTENYLVTNTTAAEASNTILTQYWNNTGFQTASGWASASTIYWNFGRAPSFFDEVCYTGTGANQTLSHNLQAVPELIIVKNRSGVRDWGTGWASIGWGGRGPALNSDEIAYASVPTWWNSTAPTASVFTVGSSATTNGSGSNFVAYLFATCAGVSKVGSYTGTGALLTVDCGFTSGARFVLIKRTDSTGDWYTYDSARGITSGNDPYLLLNSTAAEVTGTNYVDTDTTGFKVTAAAPAGLNASGGTYIFLAIA